MASITRKPTGTVSSLTTPKRGDGLGYGITYKVPSEQTKDSNHRATWIDWWWEVHYSEGGKDRMAERETWTYDMSVTSNTLDLTSFKDRKGATWKRADFWPLTTRRATSLVAWVQLGNGKGGGKWVKSTLALKVPAKPTVEEPTFDTSTGTVSATVTAAKDEGAAERYRTRYEWLVQVKRAGAALVQLARSADAFTGASKSFSYDYPSWQTLAQGEYLLVTLTATSQGLAGDSDAVTRRFVVAPPATASVSGDIEVSSTSGTGIVTVPVSVPHQWLNKGKSNQVCIDPVDGVKLQYCVTASPTVAGITAQDQWSDVGATDDGECKALACNVADVMPPAGSYTYVRVASWRFSEDVAASRRYGAAKQVPKLHTDVDTASDDKCEVVRVEPGADGESCKVTVAFDSKSATDDDATGTEVSWASSADAWRSTEQPDTFDVEWSSATSATDTRHVDGSDGAAYDDEWARKQALTIKGLEQGVKYWVRARRYKDDEGGRTYGSYCKARTFSAVATVESTAPELVVLSAPSVHPRGADMPLTWTFDGEGEQAAWQLRVGISGAGEDGFSVSRLYGDADGSGALTVPWDDVAGFADGGVVAARVRVSTGGDFVWSDLAEVMVADSPTLTVGDAEVTAQPLSLALSCDVAAEVSVVVTSNGCGGDAPGGESWQEAGDDVWSWHGTPEWQGSDGAWSATVEAPTGIDLRDGATYAVSAVATDPATGLRSAVAEAEATVSLARKAPAPAEGIVVATSDVTDEDGVRTISATLTLTAPEVAAAGDVYDVWRVSADGPALVAEGVPTDATVTDRYAPFGDGNLAYRVATRTADGDTDWVDIPYELPVAIDRIDFGGTYVELPYNLVTDAGSYSKDFEARSHLGEGLPEGYWGSGRSRTFRISASLVRQLSAEDRARLHELGRHMGPCLVRTADGCCFEADVESGGMPYAHNSSAVAVTLSGVEVALTREFMADVATMEG